MADVGVRAVVVAEHDGPPLGIVSERDIVVRALARNLPAETAVELVMTSDLVTAPPSTPTRFAYRLLRAHSIRQLPLVEGGRVVGMVERADLADEAAAEVVADHRRCPRCHSEWLHPVTTSEATNFLCIMCRACWHLRDGAFAQVETRSCPGCTEHNFCRFPLIDHGVEHPRPRATTSEMPNM